MSPLLATVEPSRIRVVARVFTAGARVLASGAGEGTPRALAIAVAAALACLVLPVALAAHATDDRPSPAARRAPAWAAAIATVGGVGRLPLAPGSFGALVALPVAWLLRDAGALAWALAIGATTLAGVVASAEYLRARGGKDPQEIVVDELAGCLIALAFVPFSAAWAAAAYVLFRVLDAAKPGVIGACERRLPGAFGVMGDDLAAGLVAGLALLLARRLFFV